MDSVVEIASLVVRSRPGTTDSVAGVLNHMPDVEVHGAFENETLVVVLEAENSKVLADYVSQIEGIDEVISATLVYHHIDDPHETVESVEGERVETC